MSNSKKNFSDDENEFENEHLIKKHQLDPGNVKSFFILYKHVKAFDILLITIGLIATIIYSLLPVYLIIEVANLVDVLEDYASENELYEEERELSIECYIFAIASLIFSWIAIIVFIKIGNRQGLIWKQIYFRTLVSKKMKWYDVNNAAEISSSIDYKCNLIEHAQGEKFIILLSAFIFFAASWIVSLIYCAELTLLCLPLLFCQFYAGHLVKVSSIEAAVLKQEQYKSAGGIVEESLEGIKTVASNNSQEQRTREYQQELLALRKFTTKNGYINGFGWGIMFSSVFINTGILYFAGAVLLEDEHEIWLSGDEISASIIVLVFYGTMLSSYYFCNSLPCLEYINSGVVAASMIDEESKKTKKFDGDCKPSDLRGLIEFEKVHFSYPSNPEVNVLSGVSFTLEPGRSLAVVGETGSGKSTIVQLIEGYYYCNEGSVKIDGVDVKDYDLSSLREFISIIQQEPILFNCSIKDNIRIGKEFASDSEVIAVSRQAEAHSYIESLPESYDTWVGVKGSQLSGGQKQRIAIARALIKNPKILLLDEATSALDVRTEKLLQETLDRITKSCTCIIVAQRLSTIRNADSIILLDSGKVAESGTFDELMELGGHFAKMVSIQNEASKEQSKMSDSVVLEKQSEEISSKDKLKIEINTSDVFGRVLKFALQQNFHLLLILISGISGGATIAVFSYLLAYDTNIILGLEGDDMADQTKGNMIYFIIDGVVAFAAILILFGSLAKLSSEFTFHIRSLCFNSLLYYDMKFFDKKESAASALAVNLSIDSENVSSLGGPVVGMQILVFTSLIGGIIIALVHDVILGLIVIAFLVPILFSGFKAEFYNKTGFIKNNLIESSAVTSDTFTNIKTVVAFNRQKYFYNKYTLITESANREAWKESTRTGWFFGFAYTTIYSIWGTVFWVGTYRVTQDEMNLDDLFIIFYSILYTYLAFMLAGSLNPDVFGGIEGGKKIYSIIDGTPQEAEKTSGIFDEIKGYIEFKNVCFKYENRDAAILSSISFEVPVGSNLAITGTTGSGKSTIAQLLLRFYDPTSGIILLDHKDISLYNLFHLRENICWVGQEPILFRGSILYNLQIGNKDITNEEAIEALNEAQASSIVKKYGLDYNVGLRGNKLSGGQKQRVSIARALVRKPKVLVLDESTSALDSVTETKVLEAISKKGFNVVSIAHRLESIKHFDDIIILEKGIIVERGSHSKLMENQEGFYYKLNMANA